MKLKKNTTYHRFLDYFGNKMPNKEAHDFEKSMMQDDFESEAYDGLSKLEEHQLEIDLQELNLGLQSRIKSKKRRIAIWLPYAASIIVLLGLSVVLLYINQNPPLDEFVSQEIDEEENLVPKTKVYADTLTKQMLSKQNSNNVMEEIIESDLVTEDIDISEDMPVVKENEEDIELERVEDIKNAKPLIAKVHSESAIINDSKLKAKPIEKELTGKVAGLVANKRDDSVQIRGIDNLSKSTGVREIKGIVLDEENMPLPGVSIVVKETNQGVLTDIDGKFKMSLSDTNPNYKLTASFIGLKPKEMDIADSLLVVLEQNNVSMDEVVVTAYGAKKEKYVTGSVAEVKMEESGRSWDKAKPSVSKNLKEYKNRLISDVKNTEIITSRMKLKISFFISSDGRIEDIKIKGTSDSDVINRVKFLIKQGDKWTPAKSNGNFVESTVRFILRIDSE